VRSAAKQVFEKPSSEENVNRQDAKNAKKSDEMHSSRLLLVNSAHSASCCPEFVLSGAAFLFSDLPKAGLNITVAVLNVNARWRREHQQTKNPSRHLMG